MNLKQLRDEIKRLMKENRSIKRKIATKKVYSKPLLEKCMWRNNTKLDGIKQTVEAIDKSYDRFKITNEPNEYYNIWQEIKELLNIQR